ncbi:SGNH/GDSL hydrolase family protein [Massilia sp. NEAU-DD11]|uniref:SGNH/GDSL hydrolase family protein n=1 Tax=Massilia cellulosiltytica TaxID=2683234 RepID=A0A7X3KAM3_9BURK|nr:SGNH/GDSL hydrolase family protein [Telluria cellulosilytica]MVW64203.1 SGNH/GDSL hydrolase family protein [Telluria cellulosilytica]
MAHIVLLGDSIFDNAPYVPAGRHVQAQLQSLVTPSDRVSLLARDGSVLEDMVAQVARLQELPEEADWIVVSCGGNDVLGLVGAMQSKVGSVIEAAALLADWQSEFRRDYRRMLNIVLSRRRPVALATIYDGVPRLDPGLRTALAPFNDVILREAIAHRLPVLDLRLICDHPDDYALVSPIEPSAQGGGKIAAAIAQLVREQDPGARRTVVYGYATW